MAVKHSKVSAVPDVGDATLVEPSDWNANHTIDPGSITDVEVAAANKDGASGTASMRTLGTGAAQAAQGSHSHTHAATTGQTANDHHAQVHGNADHTTTGTPGSSAVGDAAAQGSSASVARLDHAHGRESFATPAIVLGTAAAAGAATTPIRSDSTIVAFDATSPSTQAFGDAAATGSAAVAARRDHKHAMPSFATPAVVLGSSAAAGAATTPIRSDSTIAAFDATAPVTQALGDAAAVGTAAFAARRDHVHGMFANSAVKFASLGDVTVGEVASDFLFTTSNTTLQSITGLSFSISASATEVWLVEVFVILNAANATMDAKFGWSVPASATAQWGGTSLGSSGNYATWGPPSVAGTPTALAAVGATISIGTLNGSIGFAPVAIIFGGGTGGTVAFQGSQATSDAGQLTAKAGSVLRATRTHT